MEVKVNRENKKREKDMEKLQKALTLYLDTAAKQVRKEDHEQLRSFGIIITGHLTGFLEARICRGDYILITPDYIRVPGNRFTFAANVTIIIITIIAKIAVAVILIVVVGGIRPIGLV
ncbi:MAG: hypothetical protein J3Q66DRAFT_403016 [Benniella sp.]|nr:MAG: hypothetical protein J3Q66DRAFT_403016 [Benniella sp.]